MQNRLHTTWITIFTLIAMLWSSVAASIPVVPMHQLPAMSMAATSEALTPEVDAEPTAMSHNHHGSPCHSKPEIKSVPETESAPEPALAGHHDNCCDGEPILMQQHCCSANSGSSLSLLPEVSLAYSQISQLALIPVETPVPIRTIASALYRPPIR